MKMIKLLIILLTVSVTVSAQLDTLTVHYAKINSYYDSARVLAFDVRFEYQSDTVLGNYEFRENQGTFIMDRNRYYYKMDHAECMQSDSLLITVLEPDQLIMVSTPVTLQSGGILPLRDKMDSLKAHNFYGYNYVVNKTDTVYSIHLSATDTSREFKKISLFYDPLTYSLLRYEVSFDYLPEDDGIVDPGELIRMAPLAPRHMKLIVHFENYRPGDIGEDMFDLDRYIKADGNGQWIGAGKYEGYTVSKMFN